MSEKLHLICMKTKAKIRCNLNDAEKQISIIITTSFVILFPKYFLMMFSLK